MAIDLSRLPPPDVVEPLDFEQIYDALRAHLIELAPELADTLELESEPLAKLLQVCAYRELQLRQRVNEAAQAVMLASAQGADLEHLGAFFGVERLVIDPGDPDAIPVIPPTLEDDESLRKRIQMALSGYSTAGPAAAYVFHALSADGQVLDASATSPAPGEVLVCVLARSGDGTAPPELLDKVAAVVSAEDVRPLTDQVSVASAEILPYSVDATLYVYPGPDSAVVLEEARARVEQYTEAMRRLGRDVTLSGLYAALHVEGVQRVELAQPLANITADATQATYCTGITLNLGGVDE